MAAGLGFKEFTVGDILTAADANGYLASQTVMVFASAAARTSAITSPQEGMFSYLKDTNSTEFYTGSAWQSVAGVSAAKYGQIVSTFKSDTFTAAAASTWTDITGMSVTITPTLASSKVLVQMVLTGDGNLNDSSMAAKLLRGSTTIAVGDAGGSRIQASVGAYTGNSNSVNSMVMTFLDSPATTSATTYKVQGQALGGTNIYVNRTKTDPDSTSYARYASSITVTEILA